EMSGLTYVQFLANGPLPGRITSSLAELTTLDLLSMTNVPLTDAHLKPLGQLTELRDLWIDAGELTDAGLVHLYSLKKLRRLHLQWVDASQITAKGMAQLRAALPHAWIDAR